LEEGDLMGWSIISGWNVAVRARFAQVRIEPAQRNDPIRMRGDARLIKVDA
jgi:hypothetical protein